MPPSALAPFIGSRQDGISVSRGLVYANQSLYLVNDTFVPCAANTLSFIYLTLSPVVALAVNNSGFPGLDCLPVAQVFRKQGDIHMSDFRPEWYLAGSSSGGGGGGGGGTVASVTLPNQSGSIGSTPLLANPVSGMYAVYADVVVVSPSATGNLTVLINWNNGTTVASLQSGQIDLTQIGETSALLGNFFSASGQPISYSVSAVGDTGLENYTIVIRMVYLG